MTNPLPLHIAYEDGLLDWQLGDEHPTNPERAKIATRLLTELMGRNAVVVKSQKPGIGLLQLVHDYEYIETLMQGYCDEWEGERKDLFEVARLMAGTTLQLLHMMHGNSDFVGFAPQGAKHHAQADRSGGFCVLNDMALVGKVLTDNGKRVFYLDWDAHHGDGVEAIGRTISGMATYSIHQRGIYPGTGNDEQPSPSCFNMPLEGGSGDDALLAGVRDALELAREYRPDVLLLAAGADGMEGDPLAGLNYTLEGIAQASVLVGRFARETGIPVLIGGAGGYLPHTDTPTAWATTAATVWATRNGIDPSELRSLAAAARV